MGAAELEQGQVNRSLLSTHLGDGAEAGFLVQHKGVSRPGLGFDGKSAIRRRRRFLLEGAGRLTRVQMD